MALRNQPYFPLYVQDYLTDEKLNVCSWQSQGIYIKILCILHKQKEYGKILLRQNPSKDSSMCQEFAKHLIKLMPCQLNEMVCALEELILNDVLQVEGLFLIQKRMVKDNNISEKRANSGSKGGFAKAKQIANTIAKDIANSENENENENINEVINIRKRYEKYNLSFVKKEIEQPFYDWLEYKRIIGGEYKRQQEFEAVYRQLIEFSKGDGKTARNIIDYSITGNHPNFYKPKENTKNLNHLNQAMKHDSDKF